MQQILELRRDGVGAWRGAAGVGRGSGRLGVAGVREGGGAHRPVELRMHLDERKVVRVVAKRVLELDRDL